MKNLFSGSFFILFFYFSAFSQDVPNIQQVVITKIGATWCPNCGTSAWDNFTSLHNSFEGQAVILSIHPSSSSRLHSPESKDLAQNLPQAWGQPLFYVNKEKYSTSSIVSAAGQAIADSKNIEPIVNAGLTAILKGDLLEVDAKVKFFKESEGDFYLSLIIIEDGAIEDQSNRGSNVSHKKIVRSSLMGGTFGQSIINGNANANAEFSFTDSKTIESPWETEKLEVAAIIWEKTEDGYEFVNANSVNVSFSTSVNFLEDAGVNFMINPTIIQETAQVTIQTPISLNETEISLFNTAGQLVNELYSGNIASGVQQFTVQKNDLKGSGVYYLRLMTNGNVLTRKLVVE